MTKNELIAMATESGMDAFTTTPAVSAIGKSVPIAWLQHFAELVAAKEREACAAVAEDQFFGNAGELNHEVAAAIRERGNA